MLNLNYSTRVFSLPADAVRERLEDARENHLKALLLLALDEGARLGYPDNADALAASVGLSRKAFDGAVEYWCRAGVLIMGTDAAAAAKAEPVRQETAPRVQIDSPKDRPDPSRPQYTGAELDALIGRRPELKQLIDACENVLGKMLSPAEHNKIVELSDYLRLPDDYILMLCSYCAASGKASMHYIYKSAYTLHDEGVTETAALDEYIKNREHQREMLTKLRGMLGIGDRSITPKEREYFANWLSTWKMPYEMLERAYEITINNVDNHKFSIAYMNKILENWYNAGYRTVAEADNATAEHKRMHDAGSTQSSFDTAEFFELALRRSYKNSESNADNSQTAAAVDSAVGKDTNG